MSIPKSPIDLVNHCSAIWNNTLYVYSPNGFQSLSLEEEAEWQTLEGGEAVTGGLCVSSATANDEALYIVGGRPAGAVAALSNYQGLQRYHFSSRKWETIKLAVPITQNRVKHGAAFIKSAKSILVYSGTQDGTATALSEQTFLMSAAPPFDVVSFNSQGAPALSSPMLMPWSDDKIVLIGGSAANTQVWLFSQPQGWTNLGTTLPPGLGLDSPARQCTIVTGDDGSKVLEVYDFSASPNTVTRYALWANGAPAPVGQQVGAAADKTSKSKRQRRRPRFRRGLTLADWPAYNSTLAPSASRTAVSLAEDSNGLAVISGGNSDEPILLFDQVGNTWLNSTEFFAKDQAPITASSTPTSSLPAISTVQSTASATSSTPRTSNTSNGVLGTGQSRSKVLTTLGATLGAIFGLAAILIILLVLLRWKKQKKRRAMGDVNEKEDRLSFADQGADFMQEAQGAKGRMYSQSKSGNSSLTSLAIFQNKMASGHRRSMPSDGSQAPIVKNKSPLGVSDPLEMAHMSQRTSPTFSGKSIDYEKSGVSPPKIAVLKPAPAPAAMPLNTQDDRTRSTGWSRYFANNEVSNLATVKGENRNTYNTETSDMSRSEYGDHDRTSRSSELPPPLNIDLGPRFEGQRLSNVVTGSPTMGRSHEDIQQGLSAEIRRAGSTSSRGSDEGGFEFSRNNTPATQTTSYTLAAAAPYAKRPSTAGTDTRDTRSVGSNHSGGSNPFFGSTSQLDPRARKTSNPTPLLPQLNLQNYGEASRDSQGSAMTIFPGGKQSPRSPAFPGKVHDPAYHATIGGEYGFPQPGRYFGEHNRDSGASNTTIFPGAPAPTPASGMGMPSIVGANRTNVLPQQTKMSEPSDTLSWVDIGAGKAM